jgi:hypothetical protein
MLAIKKLKLLNSWETVRYELLNTRICDLDLRVRGSLIEPYCRRLFEELSAKRLGFRPRFYLTDCWGCPDGVPVIGVPFYLADSRLARIEREQSGYLESEQQMMMLLRHEAGHAFNYAYKLYSYLGWEETFGTYSQPYREAFRPDPLSRDFVRHIDHHMHGRTYAQKHPDEDFAETFAVWLTPNSGWRQRYRSWPALRKLRYVDLLMKEIRKQPPKRRAGKLCSPVKEMDIVLAKHYGRRAEQYRAAAQGYVDDKLRDAFPPICSRGAVSVAEFLRKHHEALIVRVARWSGLAEGAVHNLLAKLQDRADALDLSFPRQELSAKLIDVTALVTSLATNFVSTGRLTG